jgi:hypothetical protein
MSWLLAVERLVLIVASLAAMVPLWQFYNEREDRALDRAANFISAYSVCLSIEEEIASPPLPNLDGKVISLGPIQIPEDMKFSDDLTEDQLAERKAILRRRIDTLISIRRERRNTINKRCDYITEINDPMRQ